MASLEHLSIISYSPLGKECLWEVLKAQGCTRIRVEQASVAEAEKQKDLMTCIGRTGHVGVVNVIFLAE